MSWYLLAAIPVFALLVLVHEFGHFITAKWCDIRVEEFAIGFPPRALSIKRGETTYSINWLPIGGYVRMPGENGETTDENGNYDPRSFAAKPASRRALVLVAGVTMNIILAFVLFTAAELAGKPVVQPVIGQVVAGSVAEQAGLVKGDTIISINDQNVKTWDDVTNDLTNLANAAPSDAKTFQVVLVVREPGATTTKTITANPLVTPPAGQGRLGIGLDQTAVSYDRVPILQAPIQGVKDIGGVIGGTVTAIGQVIAGKLPWNQAVGGPVAIVNATGNVASAIPTLGWYWLFYLVGALSVSLAMVNILPVPALDGGRLLFIGIEVLRRGKRISPEREAIVNLVGMAALLALMVLVTFNDIGNLIGH